MTLENLNDQYMHSSVIPRFKGRFGMYFYAHPDDGENGSVSVELLFGSNADRDTAIQKSKIQG
jgi:hypothetical protein